VFYQYFEGIYYEIDITISITILFVRGERERKKNNKTDILRVRGKRKKKLFYEKKYGLVREDYSINSKRLFFSVQIILLLYWPHGSQLISRYL
jgi:hypothetical protein